MRSTPLLLLSLLVQTSISQYFDPNLNDEEYLNLTHRKVKHEVMTKRQEFVDQVETVREVTRAYIGAKIKENLFLALRTVAEKELETMSMQNRPRQPRPRQDEDEDDEISTTERGIIPQLASIVTAIFGNNENLGKYVETASKLLPRPIGQQLVGVASLLAPNQFTTTSVPRVTLAHVTPPSVNHTPSTVSQYVQQSQEFTTTPRLPVTPTAKPNRTTPGADDDDDENIRSEEELDEEYDEEKKKRRTARQFNLPGLHPMKLLDGIEALWKNYRNGGTNATTTTPSSKIKGSTTESDDGFDDDFTTKPSRLNGVVSQVDALRQGVPDLFQGAREAYKFLEHLNGFLDTWESRLLAGADTDLDD